jgi:hypothetical protein|tara:strand:- start:156 stop:554 length:399 start_codon:yes stop_codon:yes gene_type:complete
MGNPVFKSTKRSNGTWIADEWESTPLNDREFYYKSPAVKHSTMRGDFSPDKYMTRTFNRKLKMHDSFTRVLPSYNHVQNSCYTTAQSHYLHPQYKKDILYKPMTDIDRRYTHKHDFIKNYSESMYKLGVFAP